MNVKPLLIVQQSRRVIVRICGLTVMAAGLTYAAQSSFAQAPEFGADEAKRAMPPGKSLDRLRLPEGSRQTLLADRMWIHGQPAQVLVFDTPQSAAALTRSLSRQQPALIDLNVLPGRLLLSGQVGRDQWVVQMQSTAQGRTFGTISSLRVAAPSSEAPPSWLPGGARLRLDIALMEAGVKVSERIWQHVLPPTSLAPKLEAGFTREGWGRLSVDGVVQLWERQGSRVRISLVPLDAGSGLHIREWTP